MDLAILKTGALGDVVRTTSILPGLVQRHAPATITWVTAEGAVDLVATHRLVDRVCTVDPGSAESLAALERRLAGTRFDRVLSFDDEEPLCALATRLAGGRPGVLSGAYLDPEGRRTYTPDTAPWFDMGLLSVHGKEEADRRKLANTESHAAIFARMLGIEMGRPELFLPDEACAFATSFVARHELDELGPLVGLNTGAGGRWESKKLPEDKTIALAEDLAARLRAAGTATPAFLLLGGPEEGERNARIGAGLEGRVRWVDGGTRNALLDFAALIDRLDLLVTSDSLALHLAVAREVPVVAFFAPTPAAEIELYGNGVKVASTAPDYASYRRDADTSTLTVERLAEACLGVLARAPRG